MRTQFYLRDGFRTIVTAEDGKAELAMQIRVFHEDSLITKSPLDRKGDTIIPIIALSRLAARAFVTSFYQQEGAPVPEEIREEVERIEWLRNALHECLMSKHKMDGYITLATIKVSTFPLSEPDALALYTKLREAMRFVEHILQSRPQ